jgi:hypothetical protein
MQSLSQRMEGLAALEPSPFLDISLYLSLSTNQNGREDYQQFVLKAFRSAPVHCRNDHLSARVSTTTSNVRMRHLATYRSSRRIPAQRKTKAS